ncbi:MAG: hypothetical protein PHF84_12095, partial [bacterium]|nr:hypothetical protein [bacterium]
MMIWFKIGIAVSLGVFIFSFSLYMNNYLMRRRKKLEEERDKALAADALEYEQYKKEEKAEQSEPGLEKLSEKKRAKYL